MLCIFINKYEEKQKKKRERERKQCAILKWVEIKIIGLIRPIICP